MKVDGKILEGLKRFTYGFYLFGKRMDSGVKGGFVEGSTELV